MVKFRQIWSHWSSSTISKQQQKMGKKFDCFWGNRNRGNFFLIIFFLADQKLQNNAPLMCSRLLSAVKNVLFYFCLCVLWRTVLWEKRPRSIVYTILLGKKNGSTRRKYLRCSLLSLRDTKIEIHNLYLGSISFVHTW